MNIKSRIKKILCSICVPVNEISHLQIFANG